MKERNFFDRKENLKKLWRIFLACLSLLVIVDFFVERHGTHLWDRIPAFFAVYGFVACAMLVLIAKRLRRFLRRDEDYYD